MKQKITIMIGFLLLTVCLAKGSSVVVHASGNYTNPELTMTRVDDIDVYNDYIVNKLTINNTLLNNKDGDQIYKITLEQDGFVKLLLTSRGVDKVTESYGGTFYSNKTDATLTATIYRDSGLLYPVGPSVSARGTTKGESLTKIALDKGTYYIAVHTDEYVSVYNGSYATNYYVLGNAELIVYYQKVNDNETYRPSLAGKENILEMEKEFIGLLTTTNTKDYYKFELKEKALVKINFMYGSNYNAKFILYSTEREELVTQGVAGNNVWYNVEKYLEPGTYYCSLETITAYDGGVTKILLNQTKYPLNLAQKNRTTNSYVTIETIDDPMEIRYVLGKLTNSELRSSKWNSGKVITDKLKFGVNKTGYYTVRVTDQYGNMFMQSIRVTECDKTPPKKPTIKAYTANTFVISGTAEKNSTVTVTINGTAYICTANSKGAFKCTLPYLLYKGSLVEVIAQDISGNISPKAEVTVK